MVEMKREPMDQQVKKYSKMSVEAFSRLPKEELAQLGEMPEILVELPETHQKALFAVLQRYQKNEKNKKETEATTEDMPQDVTANGLNIVVHGEGEDRAFWVREGSVIVAWSKDEVILQSENGTRVRVALDEKGNTNDIFMDDVSYKGEEGEENLLLNLKTRVQNLTGNDLQDLINYARNGGHWDKKEVKMRRQSEASRSGDIKYKGYWQQMMDQHKVKFSDEEKQQIQAFGDALKRGDKKAAFNVVHNWNGESIFTHATTKNMTPGFMKQEGHFKFKMPDHMNNPEEIEAFASAMFVFNKYKDKLPAQRKYASHKYKKAQQEQMEFCWNLAQEDQNEMQSRSVQETFENSESKVAEAGQQADVKFNKNTQQYSVKVGTEEILWNKNSIILKKDPKNQIEIKFDDDNRLADILKNGVSLGDDEAAQSVLLDSGLEIEDKLGHNLFDLIEYARNGGHWSEQAGKAPSGRSASESKDDETDSDQGKSSGDVSKEVGEDFTEVIRTTKKKSWWRRFVDWLKGGRSYEDSEPETDSVSAGEETPLKDGEAEEQEEAREDEQPTREPHENPSNREQDDNSDTQPAEDEHNESGIADAEGSSAAFVEPENDPYFNTYGNGRETSSVSKASRRKTGEREVVPPSDSEEKRTPKTPSGARPSVGTRKKASSFLDFMKDHAEAYGDLGAQHAYARGVADEERSRKNKAYGRAKKNLIDVLNGQSGKNYDAQYEAGGARVGQVHRGNAREEVRRKAKNEAR